MDGTLVDSIPGIAKGVNGALARWGYAALSAEEVHAMVGWGSRQLCRKALGVYEGEVSEERLDEMESAFGEEYAQSWAGGTRVFDGMEELVRELLAGGKRVGVLSNKPHRFTSGICEELFGGLGIDPVVGAKPGRARKPDPDSLLEIVGDWGLAPGEVILVGDSQIDARTAQNAGTGIVLVDWGYPAGVNIRELGVAVVSSVGELSGKLV